MSRKRSLKNTQTSLSLEGRTITLIRDTNLVMPELWMEVYVEGDEYEQAAFAEMFVRAKCTKAKSPEEADLVVFTGGPDVNPIYYDEEKHFTTSFNAKRDESDLKLYEKCLNQGIPMFGVCRGAQFLHVMNGGKLYQDIDGHTGDHQIWDTRQKRIVGRTSSVHHQACIPNPGGGMEILADCFKSTERWLNPSRKRTGNEFDVEAFWYRDTCCLGVQGHPEYKGYFSYLQWTLQQINDLILENPDTEVRGRVRRLKGSILEQRNAEWAEKLKVMN